MIRRAAVLLALAALAGCAAPKTPAPAPGAAPSAPTPPASAAREPMDLVDMPEARLRAAFGAPAFVRRDGVSEMWRYDGAGCRAFFFLNVSGARRVVRHVETLPRGTKGPADPACLAALKAASVKNS
jgi:hypothetical protein